METAKSNICFVDCETTGLDADFHEIWEIGLILPDGTERHWFRTIDETMADPIALDIGGYHDRHPHGRGYVYPEPPDLNLCRADLYIAHEVARLTHRMHLAGAVVSFDEERLRKFLLSQGIMPTWHYHLCDVEVLVAGYLAGLAAQESRPDFPCATSVGRPPWNSNDLSRAVGVEPSAFDRHTALGDARWAMALYEAVTGEI